MDDLLTKEQFIRVLPKKCKIGVSDELIDNINDTLVDPKLRENYRDNLLSYTRVMQDGRYKISGYVAAVKYVSFKLLGDSNIEAYTKTFPDRYQRLIDEKTSDKDISSFVSAYNKTQLVQKIFEQTLTPTHIINADVYQRAINVQAVLMTDEDVSPKVRCDAANSLLTHLKMPETQKIELDIGIKEDKTIDELRQTMLELTLLTQKKIVEGILTAKEVAHSKLVTIEGEVID